MVLTVSVVVVALVLSSLQEAANTAVLNATDSNSILRFISQFFGDVSFFKKSDHACLAHLSHCHYLTCLLSRPSTSLCKSRQGSMPESLPNIM
jgi:hypothetical protein